MYFKYFPLKLGISHHYGLFFLFWSIRNLNLPSTRCTLIKLHQTKSRVSGRISKSALAATDDGDKSSPPFFLVGNLGNVLQISQQRRRRLGLHFCPQKMCARMRSRVANANAKLEQMVNFAEGQKATTLMREIFAIESSRGRKEEGEREEEEAKKGGLKSHGKMVKSGKLRFGLGENQILPFGCSNGS